MKVWGKIGECRFARPDPGGARKPLLADTRVETVPDSLAPGNLLEQATALLNEAQFLMEGDELMISLDVPYVPSPETPMIVAARADAVGKQPVDYLIRDCTETEHVDNPNNALRGVDPAGTVMDYMQRLQKKFLDIAEFKPTLLKGPQQGSLEYEVSNAGRMFYVYDPKPGFLGKDKAVFMVEYRGMHFKVTIDIHVLEIVDIHQDTCPSRPTIIKLRKSSQGNGSDLLSGELSPSVRVTDLDNGTLAQTTGTGPTAQITLDTDAANHGWYLDYTPHLNEEYLPTRTSLGSGLAIQQFAL